MQVLDDVYHAQYQADSLQPEGIAAFDVIADELVKMFNPKTAMDVGCGGGALIRGLLARGVDAYGIEGSSHALQYLPDRIAIHDLRKPFPVPFPGTFDLVTCTDVGEHIESEFHDEFADTICSLVRPGGILYFGAAGQGQDGLGHVSCFHVCHWIHIFARRGLVLKPAVSEALRRDIQAREEHAFCWWVSLNGCAYTKVSDE